MICIRFNKNRGQPGRGTMEHVWRVFDGPKEYLAKNVKIDVPSWGAKTGEDWSICCEGEITINRETSTITIGERACSLK
jgi:hypothetical protein